MSILYIRLPSKAAADSVPQWTALPCPFALVAPGNAIEREGVAQLSELSALAQKAQRVILLLAASDVSLLRIKIPPMSAARLKAALPNLVEDQIIADPTECVVVAGPEADGLRTVAVVQRNWLETIYQTVAGFGARNITALPSQLCLPYQTGTASAAVYQQSSDIDVTLRLSEHDGIGLPIMPEHLSSAAKEVLESLSAVVPQGPVMLYVPQSQVPDYQEAVDGRPGPERQITVLADNWARWIAGANQLTLNLISGLGTAGKPAFNWRPWRVPLALGAAALLINVVGLNVEWWRLKNEADALRTAMTRIYKSTYPKDTVIVDPLAQMRQKIAAAKRESGQPAADDFAVLTAAFSEAWNAAQAGKVASGVAGLEYRERSLFVRLKPEVQPPTEQISKILASRGLSLVPGPSQAGAVVWQIRSAK